MAALTAYRRRRARQDVSAFAALLETPAVGAFKLPAGARVRLRVGDAYVPPEPPVVPAGAMRWSNNEPMQFSNDDYIEWGEPWVAP